MIQLKEMRQRAGYKTQKEAAKAFGVSPTRWNSWENEVNDMGLDTAISICDFLGCTLDELAGRVVPSLPDDERELISRYRGADPRGKEAINSVARHESELTT